MYIPDLNVTSDQADKAEAIAKSFPWEGRKKLLQDEITEIVNNEYQTLEDYAATSICEMAKERASKFIERLLQGDEDAARVLFEKESESYRSTGLDEGKPWASLIHGTIFETNGMKLRREIVEANKDIIQCARIKDLESTVEGLRLQIIELNKRINKSF